MTLLELRDWLNNLNETALRDQVKIVINQEIYTVSNWRILLAENYQHNKSKAEIVWDIPPKF